MTWRKARVTFIPKSAKPSYTKAKAYCSIWLSSFLLKTLETLVGRHIRDDVLILKRQLIAPRLKQ